MSRTTSSSSVQGFSVYQPALGAPLQFLPAVGTKELDQLIDAYLPGPASAPEKRASISMNFFEYSGQTGENFKYYAVYSPVATPESTHSFTTTTSSSSSNGSPVMSTSPSQASTSQAPTPAAAATKVRAASRKPGKQERSDFTHLPGMQILTKDGLDVTNSVSRGSKSKEQRDHAHLMRILKACDACKKKKIRCDPSHKKRAASQLESESQPEAAKPVKRSKKTPSTPMAESTAYNAVRAEASFQMDDVGLSAGLSASLEEPWEQYLTFNDEPATVAIPQNLYGAIPQDFDFFFGAEKNNSFSPSASGSSVSPYQPVTPVSSGIAPHIDDFIFSQDNSLVFLHSDGNNSQEPALPYLTPGGQHGSNYMDFNLFSPASSFVDEEPRLLSSSVKGGLSALPSRHANGLDVQVSRTGLAAGQEWRFDQSHFTVYPGEPEWQHPRGHVSPARQLAAGDGELGFLGGSLPYHANDGGQNSMRSAGTVMRPQRLQYRHKNSPVATTDTRNGNEVVGTGLSSSPAATAAASLRSRSVGPRVVHQYIIDGDTGNAHVLPRTVSPTELQVVDNALQGLDSERRRPVRSVADTALPLAMTSIPAASSSRGHKPSQQRLPASEPQGLNNPLVVMSPSQTVVSENGLNAAQGLSSGSGSLLSCQQRRPGSDTANAALPVHGLGSLSQGLPCPAANIPLHLVEMVLAGGALLSTLPVRQLLTSPTVLSWLVVFGLVSLLMMVAVLSTLPTQTQTQTQTQTPILANLPITSMITLLSTISAHQRPRAKSSSGGVLDSFRSMFSGTTSTYQRSRPSWASSVARVPMLSCI